MAKPTQADQIRKLEDQMKEMQSKLQGAEAALTAMRKAVFGWTRMDVLMLAGMMDAGLEDESGLWGFVNPCDLFKLLLQSYLEKEGLSQQNQELVLAGKESSDGRILKVSCA
uniref:Uncharacterized protein n=1 Tax=Kalanchoe fedtschenkoi TaxID=63787 RepID=A0A7N1A6R5_KALFE